MAPFDMERCTIEVSGKDFELLALVPSESIHLSNIVASIDAYPFCEVLDKKELEGIRHADVLHLRAYFPRLKRAIMIFDEVTAMFPLEGERRATEITEDRLLTPYEDIVFLASLGSDAGLLQ